MSCHNDADHLPAVIMCLWQQTFRNWELIVINDGSTDGTTQVLSHAATSDTRIRVFTQANSGLTRALIRGCEEARAPYIARHDSDDRSAPDRLEKQYAVLAKNGDIGFVACAAASIGPDGEWLSVTRCSADPETATNQLLQNRKGPPAHGSVMFRRSAYEHVGGYRAPFYYAQDSDLWLRLAETSMYCCLPEVLYQFRLSPSGISGVFHSPQRMFGELGHECRQARLRGESEEPVLRKCEMLTREHRAAKRASKKPRDDGAIDYFIASQLARNGDRRGLKYIGKVLAHSPLHLKAWIRLVQLCFRCWTRRAHPDS